MKKFAADSGFGLSILSSWSALAVHRASNSLWVSNSGGLRLVPQRAIFPLRLVEASRLEGSMERLMAT